MPRIVRFSRWTGPRLPLSWLGCVFIAAAFVTLQSPSATPVAAAGANCVYTLTTLENTPVSSPLTSCTVFPFTGTYTGVHGGTLVVGFTSMTYTPPLNYVGSDDVQFGSTSTPTGTRRRPLATLTNDVQVTINSPATPTPTPTPTPAAPILALMWPPARC